MATLQQSNRILIVEDDASMRGLMARHFRRQGFEVEQATAAEEVLERFGGRSRFDVVLTDVHLPGESGVNLARRIKEIQPEQPVVFMTGDADAGLALEALRDGAAGYLLKPFEFFELDAVVNNAVQRSSVAASPRLEAVARGLGKKPAHVTVPAKVVLAPARPRRSRLAFRVRVVLATAAMLLLGWLAGVGLAPAPVNATPTPQFSNANDDNRPVVVPVVIERSIYLK